MSIPLTVRAERHEQQVVVETGGLQVALTPEMARKLAFRLMEVADVAEQG